MHNLEFYFILLLLLLLFFFLKACYGPAQTTLVLNGALHMTVYSCANLSSGPILEVFGCLLVLFFCLV